MRGEADILTATDGRYERPSATVEIFTPETPVLLSISRPKEHPFRPILDVSRGWPSGPGTTGAARRGPRGPPAARGRPTPVRVQWQRTREERPTPSRRQGATGRPSGAPTASATWTGASPLPREPRHRPFRAERAPRREGTTSTTTFRSGPSPVAPRTTRATSTPGPPEL